MATKGRIDSIIDLQKTQEEVKALISLISGIVDKVDEISDKASNVKISFGSTKSITDLHRAYAAYEIVAEEAVKTSEELTKKTQKLIEVESLYSKQKQAALNQLAKLEAKERELQSALEIQIKTLKDAEIQNKALRVARSQVDASTEIGRRKIDEYNKTIDKNTQFIRTNIDIAGKQKLNIGNYTGAFSEALSNLGINTSKFTSSIGSMTSGMGAAGIAMGLITGASSLLKMSISATDNLADKFAITLEKGKAAASVFFKALAEGDFSNFISNIRIAIQEGERYAKVLDYLEDAQRAAGLQEAKYMARISELKIEMRDVTKTDQQRIKAIDEILEIENKIGDERKRLAKIDVDNQLKNKSILAGINRDRLKDLIENYSAYEKQFEYVEKLQAAEKRLKIEQSKNTGSTSSGAYGSIGANRADTASVEKDQKLIEGLKRITEGYSDEIIAFGKVNKEERDAIASSLKKMYEAEAYVNDQTLRAQTTRNRLLNEAFEDRKKGTDDLVKASEKEAIELEKRNKEAIQLKLKSLQNEISISDIKLDIVKKGSIEELGIIYDKLKKLEELELAQAAETGKSTQDIRDKYMQAWIDKNLEYSLNSLDRKHREEIINLNNAQANELSILSNSLKTKEKTYEEYEKEKERITRDYEIRRADLLLDKVREELTEIENANGDTLKAREALTEATISLDNLKTKVIIDNSKKATDKQKRDADELKAAQEKLYERLIELGQELFNTTQSFANASFETRLQNIDSAARKDEEEKERELARAGNNKAMIDQINAKYDAREKQRDAQRKKIQIEQARFAKAAAIFQIAIDTALSIMSVMKDNTIPVPIKPVFVAIAAGIGIAQAAAVDAQPLPKYWRGRETGPAEWAIVGDRGQEAIQYPSGETYLTPDKPTITFLPARAKVIPNQALINSPELFIDRTINSMPLQFDLSSLEEKVEGLHRGFEMLADTVRNKKEFHLNITERGMWKVVQSGNSFQEYLNRSVRI